MTPDLTCPSTHQLLWSSPGYSGPNMSSDLLASPEYLSGLARVSLAEVFKLPFFSRSSEGDYTSSCPPNLVLSSYLVSARLKCLAIGIEPTMTLFRVFQTLYKQGDWFSFAKRRDPAIPDYMTWRHPKSAIYDPKPVAGSYRMAGVRRLSAHVVKLRDMPVWVLVLSGLSRV
ncbi:hypothetical protein Tco_0983919 [Tanacetum coccineum]